MRSTVVLIEMQDSSTFAARTCIAGAETMRPQSNDLPDCCCPPAAPAPPAWRWSGGAPRRNAWQWSPRGLQWLGAVATHGRTGQASSMRPATPAQLPPPACQHAPHLKLPLTEEVARVPHNGGPHINHGGVCDKGPGTTYQCTQYTRHGGGKCMVLLPKFGKAAGHYPHPAQACPAGIQAPSAQHSHAAFWLSGGGGMYWPSSVTCWQGHMEEA